MPQHLLSIETQEKNLNYAEDIIRTFRLSRFTMWSYGRSDASCIIWLDGDMRTDPTASYSGDLGTCRLLLKWVFMRMVGLQQTV